LGDAGAVKMGIVVELVVVVVVDDSLKTC